jgi:hypothetical protein
MDLDDTQGLYSLKRCLHAAHAMQAAFARLMGGLPAAGVDVALACAADPAARHPCRLFGSGHVGRARAHAAPGKVFGRRRASGVAA